MATSRKIKGQESWVIGTPDVEAAITKMCGHLAPVRFRLGSSWVEPFEIAPWAEEKLPAETPELMRAMRGDFFCMPFGGNQTEYRGEKFPSHGETAQKAWKLESSTPSRLHLSMETTVRKGRVDKILGIVRGHSAIYLRHVISGMKGPMSFGHHPILKVDNGEVGRVSISRFTHGQVFPEAFENPVQGGYSILKPGAKFKTLNRVPQVDGKWADLSVYPAREGYEDLVMMATDKSLPFGWTSLTFPSQGYVWFALKDPKVLRSTVFWMSNGGRHYAPWSGRHRHAIGLEEVTSYFHCGIAESAKPNSLSRAGIETCAQLSPKRPLTVNYIMAVAAIPRGFDVVKTIRASADGKSVSLTSQSGKTTVAAVDVSFLFGADGELLGKRESKNKKQ